MMHISQKILPVYLLLLKILYVFAFVTSLWFWWDIDIADYREGAFSANKLCTIFLMLVQGGLLCVIMRPLVVQKLLIGSVFFLLIPTKGAGILIPIILMAINHVFEILAFFVFLTQQRIKIPTATVEKVEKTKKVCATISKPFKFSLNIFLLPFNSLKINNLWDVVYLLSLIACVVWPIYMSEANIRLKEVVVPTFAITVVQAVSLKFMTRAILIPAVLIFLGVLHIVWNVPTWDYSVYHTHFESITYYTIDFMLSNHEELIKFFIKYPILQVVGLFLFLWRKSCPSKKQISIVPNKKISVWLSGLYIITFAVSLFYFNGFTQTSLPAMCLAVVEAFLLFIMMKKILLPLILFALSLVNIFVFLYPEQIAERLPGFCVEALKILPTYQLAELVGFALFLYMCWVNWEGKSKFFNAVNRYQKSLASILVQGANEPVSPIKVGATYLYIGTVIFSIVACLNFITTEQQLYALIIQAVLLLIIAPRYFTFITALLLLFANIYMYCAIFLGANIDRQLEAFSVFIMTQPVLETIGICVFVFNRWGVQKWTWSRKLYNLLTLSKLAWLWVIIILSIMLYGIFIGVPLVGFVVLKGKARIWAIMMPPIFANIVLFATVEGMGVLLIILGSIPYAIVCGILAIIASALDKRKKIES